MMHQIQITLQVDDQGLSRLLYWLRSENIPAELHELAEKNDNANSGMTSPFGFDPAVDC
jgi:hypothetical protein